MWKCKGLRIAQTMLQKNDVGKFTVSNFKTFFKTLTIKIVLHWHHNGHID